ncbi:hypothetical protein ACLMJK_008151 [Lecanora helva]
MASPPSSALPILPPIVTLNSLSQAVDAADSPSTAATATPVTADILSPDTYKQPDYFGEDWHSKSPKHLKTGTKRPAPSASPNAKAPSPLAIDPCTNQYTSSSNSIYSPRTAARLRHTDRRRMSQNTYNRDRNDPSKGSKSSGTTEGESSASDHRIRTDRPQRRKAPSQKAMLSKALQKAHHAVTLDQHSNYEGAMQAYQEACALLQKVMIRSSGVEDRLKLDAVRNTYEARIAELRGTDQSYQNTDGKALPERPPERDSRESERLSIVTDTDESEAVIETATATPLSYGQHVQAQKSRQTHVGMMGHVPARRQSLQRAPPQNNQVRDSQDSFEAQDRLQPLEATTTGANFANTPLYLETPTYQECMPPPLSPRRPSSPNVPPPREIAHSSVEASTKSNLSDEPDDSESIRQDNDQHTSWLNTINESSGSSSSVHSRRSSVGLRRKHIRAASGETEAEFNAALDQAIETAYDDGFEPDDEDEDDEQLLHDPQYRFGGEPIGKSMSNNELAKESVREAEREAIIAQAKDREQRRLQDTRDSVDTPHTDEDDEEERMLEEMTRDYILAESEYDAQTKSALPRQSDSSGFSGRTWGSSIGSNPTSAGTSLSTVAEASALPLLATQLKENPLPPPLHPPPSGALPPPPAPPPKAAPPGIPIPSDEDVHRPSLTARNTSPGVRERRLSGLKRKPLKIETNGNGLDANGSRTATTQPPHVPASVLPDPMSTEPSKSGLTIPESQQTLGSPAARQPPTSATYPNSRKGSSAIPGSDSADVTSSTASALTKVTSADSDNSVPSMPSSPARFGHKAATGLRKNFSSSSLRKQNLTVSVPDATDNASNASLSSLSSTPKQQRIPSPAVPILPTPIESSFIVKGQPMAGMYLFDSDIHSTDNPGSPNPSASNPPLPLEPCPESTLLRPFWFLRAVYQTIAHPRGGYLSQRLFVPRDIWKVKNMKLKNVEEKVSSCDLLTAALLKLGKVDTFDAKAVLEEMQFFESIMEQVQTTLSKKLGNDVGVQGATQFFKNSSPMDESASSFDKLGPKASTANSKSYWRKLRPKNSLGPGPPITSGIAKDVSKEGPTMKSLPMTNMSNPKFPRRDVNQVQCTGFNPSYMGALARLCDAAQVLDQITRQVEDPGLKHSSEIYVGLELSARHAAEFFAFYICRFVFADIGMMLDKFIKRGSEWVLS